MQLISIQQINGWVGVSSPHRHFPTAVNIQCGVCNSFSTITLAGTFAGDSTWIGVGECQNSKCKATTRLLCYYDISAGIAKPVKMFIDPSPARKREPIEFYDLIGDDRVKSAYLSVLDTYNKGAFMAVPTVVGRALEGVLKDQLKDKEVDLTKVRMLGPLVKKLAELVDLSAPLKDLAEALTKGRNIGAHFDLDLEPNEIMSFKMLELLEVIIEYIYVLPTQVEDFGKFIASTTSSPD